MKHDLGEKIMNEFVTLRPKTYTYLTDNNDEDNHAKGAKRFVVKRKIKFEDYKLCLEATQLENKINHLEKYNLNEDNFQENHKEFIKKTLN